LLLRSTLQAFKPLAFVKWGHWAPLPLRLIVGYGFLVHGLAKLQKGPENFVAIVDAIGVPMPALMAWLAILVELLCGVAMIAGIFVPLLIIPMLAVLAVAMFTVHLPFGFSSIKLMAVTAVGPKFGPPGYETDLAALALTGPGPFAIDNCLVSKLAGGRSD
jgi:putative oxidoreductase